MYSACKYSKGFVIFVVLFILSTFLTKSAFAAEEWTADLDQPTAALSVYCAGDTTTNLASIGTSGSCTTNSATITITYNDTGGSNLSTVSTTIDGTANTTCTTGALGTNTCTLTQTLNNSSSQHTITINRTGIADGAGNNPASVPPTFTLNFHYSIAGTVWVDQDADGTKDTGEPNYTAGTINLSASDGTTTYTAATTTGNYTIIDLPAGTYTVILSIPSGYGSTTGTCNTPTTCKSTSDYSTSITVGPNATGKNFGITKLSTISGTVYVDNAHDCTTTTTYTSTPSVTVGGTASGGANGTYTRVDLISGAYEVVFTAPNGYRIFSSGTSCTAGSITTANKTVTVTIPTNSPADQTHNFYITPIHTISGNVYRDVDGNGVYTSGTDTAFSTGTTNAIHLKDSANAEITASSPVNSNASGYYAFANIVSGSYTVSVDTPTGFKQVLYIGIVTQPLTVNANTTGINFLVQGFRIDVNVYTDYDHNGAKDAGVDTNYSGASLALSGTASKTGTTTASGNYSFVDLVAGAYTLTLTIPSGYKATTNTTNCTPSTCIGGAVSQSITISSADNTNSFGLTPLYTITGNVYKDNNKNKFRDAGEIVYEGDITITSTDPLNTGFISINKNNGSFTISNLLSNTADTPSYTIEYTGLPTGYELTYPKPSQYIAVVGQNVPGITCGYSPPNLDPNAISPCSNGNISNLNFGITNSLVWWQCIGADCRLDGGISNTIPPSDPGLTACTIDGNTQRKPSIANSNNSAGLIFSGNTNPFWGGATWVPEQTQIVGGTSFPEKFKLPNPNTTRTSYDFMVTTARQNGIELKPLELECELTNCILPNNIQNGTYESDGDLTLAASSNCGGSRSNCYKFSNNSKIVILVKGNLTINEDILVPTDSSVTFSVKGDIIVKKDVGVAYNTSCDPTDHDGCNIEGFYSADEDFIIEGYGTNDCVNGGINEKRLNVAGSIIVNAGQKGGAIQNQRDLCILNLQCPTYTITGRPDFLLNSVDFIQHPNYIWKEEAP